MRKTVTYVYRGDVERVVRAGGRAEYRWFRGYSSTGPRGGVLYPWMTKAECRVDAAAQGAVALFEEQRCTA